MQHRKHRIREGFTLVEATILVCLVGVVLAAFVPTFVGELRTSKVAEAAEQLETLHRLAAGYYSSRFEKPSGRPVRRCLPPPAGPAPKRPTVDPVEVDFTADTTPGADTWAALGFAPGRPTRFRYSFAPRAWGCELRGHMPAPLLTLRAEGDLDGDGKRSSFERSASVDENGALVPFGVLQVLDRVE